MAICFFFPFLTFCQDVLLTSKTSTPFDLESQTAIFEDKTSQLPFLEVQKQTFTPFKKDGFLFPFSDHIFWVKFTVKNADSEQENWILNWDNFLAENVHFYVQQENGSFKLIKKGALTPKPKYIRDTPHISFKLKPGQTKTIYVKVESQRGQYAYLTLYTAETFTEYKFGVFTKESFFNGLIILRLFYVILLALFVVKEESFRAYSALLVTRSLAYWGLLGILGGVFTNHLSAVIIINFLAYHILPIGQVLAVRAILPLHRFPAFVKILFNFVIGITLLLSVCIVLDYRWYWLKASTYLVIFTQLFIFGLYVVAVFRKYVINWYYSVPFLLGIGSYIFIQMRLVGWLDFSWIYSFATLCFISEVFVFGIFLSRIILNYEKAKVSSEKQLLFNQEQTGRLQELDQLKTNFFTNISHEFRTPLTLLVGPLADLRKKYPTESFIPVMQRNVARLQSLINQLLDLSKLEAKQLEVEAREGDLAVFLQQLFASFESLAQGRKIIFNHAQSHAQFSAFFDADKVEKIVTNLLSNAFKFTPANGRVNVRVEYSETEMTLKVQDSGIGIDAERLIRIFDRFYQAQTDNQRNYEGTGIGLALVKELVDVLKGEISVASEVGKGTVFTVKLRMDANHPFADNRVQTADKQLVGVKELKAGQAEQTFPVLSEVSLAALSSPLLLIVEDNPDLRAYVRTIFEPNYHILEAIDGQDGLQKAFEQVPDVVICDLMMPRLDGLSFCEMLKTDVRTNHIPVIMLTAKATLDDRLKGLQLGADDYLSKPFNREELEIRIGNLLKQRETLRQKYVQQVSKISSVTTKEKNFSLDEQFLQKAREMAEMHLGDSSFDVERFSKEMNMSRTNLHRKLKALTDVSTTEFIRNIRLQRAAQLLKQHKGTVSDIAYQVGFESLPYFSKSFQEQFGVPPSEYARTGEL